MNMQESSNDAARHLSALVFQDLPATTDTDSNDPRWTSLSTYLSNIRQYTDIPCIGSSIPSSAEKTEYSCVITPETVWVSRTFPGLPPFLGLGSAR